MVCYYIALVSQLVTRDGQFREGRWGWDVLKSATWGRQRHPGLTFKELVFHSPLVYGYTHTEQHFSTDNGCLGFSYLTLLDTLVRRAMTIPFYQLLWAPPDPSCLSNTTKNPKLWPEFSKPWQEQSALTTTATILVSHDAELWCINGRSSYGTVIIKEWMRQHYVCKILKAMSHVKFKTQLSCLTCQPFHYV